MRLNGQNRLYRGNLIAFVSLPEAFGMGRKRKGKRQNCRYDADGRFDFFQLRTVLSQWEDLTVKLSEISAPGGTDTSKHAFLSVTVI